MTDATKFKLLATFRLMKQKISMTSFNERLVMQKKVYLLQQLGLNLGNSYGWYLRGPYSRDVANDGFSLQKVQEQIVEVEELTTDEKRVPLQFERLLKESEERLGKDEAYCLELLASLHFVLRYGYPKPPTNEHAIFQLTVLKPKFKDNAKLAMELLKEYGLA